jgi:mRNA interferase RelE/StbE
MNGGYRVFLLPSAQRDLDKITGDALAQVQEAMNELGSQPRGTDTKKLQGKKNVYRKRSGKFRILYEINDADHEVNVLHVVDRKDAYKR